MASLAAIGFVIRFLPFSRPAIWTSLWCLLGLAFLANDPLDQALPIGLALATGRILLERYRGASRAASSSGDAPGCP